LHQFSGKSGFHQFSEGFFFVWKTDENLVFLKTEENLIITVARYAPWGTRVRPRGTPASWRVAGALGYARQAEFLATRNCFFPISGHQKS
jgi:hypothetical protein